MLEIRVKLIGLTSEGYDAKKGIEILSKRNREIWWFRVSKEWVTEELWRFIMLFLFRIKPMHRNDDFDAHNYWGFSDDRATGHKALYHWIIAFLKHFDGVYGPISPNVTAYTQIADDPLCNGQFKRMIRRKGRDWMRRQLVKGMNDDTEHKKVIPKVSKLELDVILGQTLREINSLNGIRMVQKAFHHKLDPKKYDIKIRKCLKRWEEIKHKPSEILFPDKKNYWNNIHKKNTEFKGIDESLLNYKNPKLAYKCICGWTYSSKYKKKRIEEHDKICPIKSDYGVVPAFQPKNMSHSDDLIIEFIGYKERLKDNKCMFDIKGKHIAYSDGLGDHEGVIIQDMGRGYVLVRDERNIGHVFKLKKLKYHNTVKIWRNY